MPASVYEVAVVSRNRFGWSDSSKVIRFATSGESKYSLFNLLICHAWHTFSICYEQRFFFLLFLLN